MKQLLLLSCCSVIFSGLIYSQSNLYNADFEAWSSQPNPVYWQDPLGWSTSNSFTGNMGCGGGPGVYADTQCISGQFAARIISVEFGFAAQPYPGYIVNGTGLTINENGEWNLEKSGTAINTRPSALHGYYRYESWTTPDSAWIEIILSRYNPLDGKRDTLAFAHTRLGPSSNYKTFNVPITYANTSVTPDTICIFIASTDPYNPVPGGVLLMDNLSLQESGGTNTNFDDGIQVFPNPTQAKVYFSNKMSDNIRVSRIEAYNSDGRKVYEHSFSPSILNPSCNIRNWEPSIYLFKYLADNGQVFTYKIVKI